MELGTVPDTLKLAIDGPFGVRCYRRRFTTPATQTSYTAGQYIDIFPDTTTPGAFIDTKTTYLMADLSITNNRFDVDYQDFGIEGAWGALIEEWRCYNQGSVTEEIVRYSRMASLISFLEGMNQKETSLYFSAAINGHNREWGRNLIKSPMVDINGNIMYGPNPYGLGRGVNFQSAYALTATSTGSTQQTTTQVLNECLNSSGLNILFQTKGIVGSTEDADKNTDYGDTTFGVLTSWKAACGALNPQRYPWVNTLLSSVNLPADNSSTSKLPAGVSTITPMDFPEYFDPSDVSITSLASKYVTEFGSINKPHLMQNLCNVKCFPIGQIAQQKCFPNMDDAYKTDAPLISLSSTQADSSKYIAVAPVSAKGTTYRICYRPYSGIIGKFARKALATMLLSPQQFSINIKLAENRHFFNLSFDPCRRVCGTIRDYIRNTGYGNGSLYMGFNGASTGAVNGPSGFNIPSAAQSIYIYNANNQLAPGYVPTALAMQKCSNINSAPGKALPSVSSVFNVAAASGRTFIAPNSNSAIINVTTSIETNQSVGCPGQLCSLPPAPQYMLSVQPWKIKNVNAPGQVGSASTLLEDRHAIYYANEHQVLYGTYLDESVPQSSRIGTFDKSGNGSGQTQNIYKPQIAETDVQFTLTNVNLVGQQLIFSDAVARDIVDGAMAGLMNVSTESVRAYPITIQSGMAEQNILVPAKCNKATALYFMFQNQKQRGASEAFLYDSNCGFNPFALVQPSANSKQITLANGHSSKWTSGLLTAPTKTGLPGVGWDLDLDIQHTSVGADGAMSCQLQIGSDFYPPNPIRSMVEIAQELLSTMDVIQSDHFSTSIDASVLPSFKNNAVTYQYNCLEANKFTTAFIPLSVLDDQTITANPDFIPLYACPDRTKTSIAAGDTIRGGAADGKVNGANYLNPRGYCLQKVFRPPSSRFILGFDLSSWHNSDFVKSGEYLGNSMITLQLKGAIGFTGIDRWTGNAEAYEGICFARHHAMLRYSKNGALVWAF